MGLKQYLEDHILQLRELDPDMTLEMWNDGLEAIFIQGKFLEQYYSFKLDVRHAVSALGDNFRAQKLIDWCRLQVIQTGVEKFTIEDLPATEGKLCPEDEKLFALAYSSETAW